MSASVSIPDRDYVRFKPNLRPGTVEIFPVSIPDRDYVRFKLDRKEFRVIRVPKFQSLIGIM